MASLKLTSATIVTMNDAGEVVDGDVSIRDGRIAAVGRVDPALAHDRTVDVGGAIVLPGFVQTHVHLCQTLFRGLADDLPLLAWLRSRIWPLEAAHDDRSLAASTRLAAAELLLGGTTTVLTMETVRGTDAVFDALAATGLRAVVGKCLMDDAPEAPAALLEPAQAGLDAALDLARRWTGAAGGRLTAALAPRFAVTCSPALLEGVAAAARDTGLLVHTHAAEQRDEVDLIVRRTGRRNVRYLADVGLASPRVCLAHCVWVDDDELALLAERQINVLHCPASNLKLGSGIAPVAAMRRRGIPVSLGADGAACNNRLDMFTEMRLAATLQAVREAPGALTAGDALWMATRGGAAALGLDAEIGQVTAGYRADLAVVGRDGPHMAPPHDPIAALVYGASAADVRMTLVDGQVLVEDGRLTAAAVEAVRADAARQARLVAARAGL